MPTYTLAFLVDHDRDVKPPLELAGITLVPISVTSEHARARLQDELGQVALERLESDGNLPAVLVEVEAADEKHAIALGYQQAKMAIEPYSLLEPERQAIDL